MIRPILFISIITLFSCSSTNTMITGTWRNPDLSQGKPYESIMVTALTDNVNAKSIVENDLAAKLSEQGKEVSKSMDVFPPNFSDEMNDKEKILGRIRNNGTDAIITISLIDKDTETRYIPGNYAYNPVPAFGYYGRFWGYYSHWYPRMFAEPGYYTEDKIYYLETNLYDANTEELLWSAQSETLNPEDLTAFSREFTERIVNEMNQDGIL